MNRQLIFYCWFVLLWKKDLTTKNIMILPSDQTTVEPISCPAVGIFVPVIGTGILQQQQKISWKFDKNNGSGHSNLRGFS